MCCTDRDSSPCDLYIMALLNLKAASLTSLGSVVLEQYGYKMDEYISGTEIQNFINWKWPNIILKRNM